MRQIEPPSSKFFSEIISKAMKAHSKSRKGRKFSENTVTRVQSCRKELQRQKGIAKQLQEDKQYIHVFGDNIEICREEQDKMKPGHGYSKSMQINSRNVQELGIKVKTNGFLINDEALCKNQNYLMKIGKRLRNVSRKERKTNKEIEKPEASDLFSQTTNKLNIIKAKTRPQTTQNRRIGKSSQFKRKTNKISEGFGKDVSSSTHFKSKESSKSFWEKNNISSNFDISTQFKSVYDWSFFFPMKSGL